MLIENKISLFEKDVAKILSSLSYHIHPDIIKFIQDVNSKEHSQFKILFGDNINIESYLFEGSACVFPGVRRYVSGQGKKKSYNPEYKAIIDDNTFPRHLWCFLANNKTYSGPNWIDTRLNEFELAHVFTHKETEIDLEAKFFNSIQSNLEPHGDFTCAGNVVLLPKGTVRPTDNSETLKSVFYMRYIDLYGETPLNGRKGFIQNKVPDWYHELTWNKPILPIDWKEKIKKLLIYRTNRISEILNKI